MTFHLWTLLNHIFPMWSFTLITSLHLVVLTFDIMNFISPFRFVELLHLHCISPVYLWQPFPGPPILSFSFEEWMNSTTMVVTSLKSLSEISACHFDTWFPSSGRRLWRWTGSATWGFVPPKNQSFFFVTWLTHGGVSWAISSSKF